MFGASSKFRHQFRYHRTKCIDANRGDDRRQSKTARCLGELRDSSPRLGKFEFPQRADLMVDEENAGVVARYAVGRGADQSHNGSVAGRTRDRLAAGVLAS